MAGSQTVFKPRTSRQAAARQYASRPKHRRPMQTFVQDLRYALRQLGKSPAFTWTAGKPNFFLPVQVLSSLFRRLFLESLQVFTADGHILVANLRCVRTLRRVRLGATRVGAALGCRARPGSTRVLDAA